jgi:hypothetical protein
MKLDKIIRMIDNKEYVSIGHDSIGKLSWYDMKFENGSIVRVEKCHGVDGEPDSFMVLYIVPNEKTASEVWNGDYRNCAYYIFSNIYNELERTFE